MILYGSTSFAMVAAFWFFFGMSDPTALLQISNGIKKRPFCFSQILIKKNQKKTIERLKNKHAAKMTIKQKMSKVAAQNPTTAMKAKNDAPAGTANVLVPNKKSRIFQGNNLSWHMLPPYPEAHCWFWFVNFIFFTIKKQKNNPNSAGIWSTTDTMSSTNQYIGCWKSVAHWKFTIYTIPSRTTIDFVLFGMRR